MSVGCALSQPHLASSQVHVGRRLGPFHEHNKNRSYVPTLKLLTDRISEVDEKAQPLRHLKYHAQTRFSDNTSIRYI